MRSRKRRKTRRAPSGGEAANIDLNAASLAQLGPDPDKRPNRRPQPYDASIEDPLKDWPQEER